MRLCPPKREGPFHNEHFIKPFRQDDVKNHREAASFSIKNYWHNLPDVVLAVVCDLDMN